MYISAIDRFVEIYAAIERVEFGAYMGEVGEQD